MFEHQRHHEASLDDTRESVATQHRQTLIDPDISYGTQKNVARPSADMESTRKDAQNDNGPAMCIDSLVGPE